MNSAAPLSHSKGVPCIPLQNDTDNGSVGSSEQRFFSVILFSKSGYEGSLLYEVFDVLGFSLIVVATLGRLWSIIFIGGRKQIEICKEGPYSLCRNPLYVFSFSGAVGIILCSGELVLLFVVLPFFIYNYYFVIKGEEQRLLEWFGDEFAEYCRQVNRVVPNFKNYYSRAHFDIYPKVFFRQMKDSSNFLWLFIFLEFVEYVKLNTDWLPVLFTVPF
ncbi:methyltransferase family protein [Thermodesulfobacteriota bacterium]